MAPRKTKQAAGELEAFFRDGLRHDIYPYFTGKWFNIVPFANESLAPKNRRFSFASPSEHLRAAYDRWLIRCTAQGCAVTLPPVTWPVPPLQAANMPRARLAASQSGSVLWKNVITPVASKQRLQTVLCHL
jgi:hypothetical protein